MNLNDYYSTIVVGVGPAGIMAAKNAAANGRVLLVDQFKLPRKKSCGGMLNPYSQHFLKNKGFDIPADIICEPNWLNFRFFDWDRNIRKATTLRFVNVDRVSFDEWLLSLLPSNVEICDNTRFIHCTQSESHVNVTLQQADDLTQSPQTITCDYLIGCDGPRSSVRRSLDVTQLSLYKTVQEFIPCDSKLEPYFDCIYSRHIGADYGYGYIIPKTDYAIVGSVFFPRSKDCASLHKKALKTFDPYYHFASKSFHKEAWSAVQVRSAKDIVGGQGRVLLAGEAGGLMSPSSGEGISFALNSGELAGKAICSNSYNVLETYRAMLKPIKKNIQKRLLYFPVLNSNWGKWLGGSSPQFLVDKVAHKI